MATMPKLIYPSLEKSVHRAVSAHKRVTEGIATHAEKEHVRRQERHAKMEAERPLKVQANEGGNSTSSNTH